MTDNNKGNCVPPASSDDGRTVKTDTTTTPGQQQILSPTSPHHMFKRKRVSLSSYTLPLTRDNLHRLQESLSSSTDMSRLPSPTRTKNNLDARTKLEEYRVHIDTGHPYPLELADFMETVIRRPRDATIQVSPNASKIVKMRRYAAAQNERTGINKVAPYLLFTGEADFDDRVPGVPHITAKQDISLNKLFLPPAPSTQVTKTWGALSSPQPDSCLGYVKCSDAQAAGHEAPFQPNEESILHSFSLTQYMHFPFLTAQWKVPNSNENLHSAQNQAARDGATIVNYLHDMYTAADGISPTTVQTCHFSVQSDLQHGGLWVHWREESDHYMELVYDFSMRDQTALENLRGLLLNVLNNALGERLKSIKATLPKFAESQKCDRYPAVRPVLEDVAPSESSVSQSCSLSNSIYPLRAPLAPSSATSEPEKSRKRKHGSHT